MPKWLVISLVLTFLSVNGVAQRNENTADTTFRVVQTEKVVVKGRKSQYRKRGNPAVELAERLIAARDVGNPNKASNLIFTRHEKIIISLDEFKLLDSTSKLAALNNNVIINTFTGHAMLPLSLKERVIETTVHNGTKGERELSKQSYGVDEKIDAESVMGYLETAMESVDLFTDYISLVQRRFLSPLARSAPDFFKFHLDPDTTTINGSPCVRLVFFPHNKEGLGLRGSLFVRADSSLFIERAMITMPLTADVNYVRRLDIELRYRLDSTGYRLLDHEDLNIDLSVVDGTPQMNARRINQYLGYEFLSGNNPLPSVRAAHSVSRIDTSDIERVRTVTRTLRRRPLYLIMEELTVLATQGYLGTGKNSKFDFGPILNFISGNELEGTRLMVGGITTPNLIKRMFFEGYVAYGIRDERWKYALAVEYSFNSKVNHLRQFPIHSLRLSYTDDVNKFGTPFGMSSPDNVFSWLKRAPDSALTYMRRAELSYSREFESHLSFSITARHYTQSASAVLQFAPTIDRYKISELDLRLRYAPGEVIFQTKRRRYNLQKYYPVVELRHSSSLAGFLGSDYSSHLTELDFTYRLNIQPLGYLDLMVRGGGQWSTVPYMLLPHPRTNLSYVVRTGSFSLMRPLEYLYDRYVQWDISYYMDGLLLSRIPLIKKLKIREVLTFRGVWGTLTGKNNPSINMALPPLPSSSSAIGGEPYMEVGVGIENILNIFRIDYVWRLTYLDNPSAIGGGILIGATFKF